MTVAQYATMADMELVGRFQEGDMRAFEVIYERHHSDVLRFLLGKTSYNYELAEDVAADTFIRAHGHMHGFKASTGGGLGAWLVTIARNLLNDHWRSHVTKKSVYLDDEQWGFVDLLRQDSEDVLSPEEVIVAEAARMADGVKLALALPRLTQLQRTCLLHRFFAELSVRETAKAMDMTAEAVRNLQYRALARLHRVMTRT